MNQIVFTALITIVGYSITMPFRNGIPILFRVFSAYTIGSLVWVLISCVLLVFGHFKLPFLFFLAIFLVMISLVIARRIDKLIFNISECGGYLLGLFIFPTTAILVTKFNFSIATIDSAARIFTGMSLVKEGFTDANLVILSHNNIFQLVMQATGYMIGDHYLYTYQPLSAFSLIGIFISLTYRSLKTLDCRLKILGTIAGMFFLGSTYFIAFQAFYIHDNLVESIFLFICVISFWLAKQVNNSAWLFFGSLASIGASLTRAEGPVFAILILLLAISQDRFPYKTRLWTYLTPTVAILIWYGLILSATNSEAYFLSTERVLLVIVAYIGLGFLTLQSNTKWIKEQILPRLPIIMITGIILLFTGFFLIKSDHLWTNISMIASNMFHYGRWNIFWHLILPLVFFTIPLPKFRNEQFYTIFLTLFFFLLIILGGLRNPYRLGWSDSANRMLVHIAPLLVMFLVLKYSNAWQTNQKQVLILIKEKGFNALLAIPIILIILGGFFWLTKPVNYATEAKAIHGADEFADNHPFSSALREDKNSKYAETQSAGDFTVVIDLQNLVHANIIELSVESDSTDASAQRMLSDIGWAVSSDNANWTVIYQPPSTNMTNVRLVHNSRFQYPVGQVESFRYVRMTFKPVNPEERLKIKEINIWSHSPDGYYPDK